MPHDDVELRILGALSEKERLTPDLAPLTTSALVDACNQRTARDPVMNLTDRDVETAVVNLRAKGLVSTVQGERDRVPKHRQRLIEALGLNRDEAAVLTVLLLRGAQTPGELRSRCERYGGLPDVDAVARTLQRLIERSPAVVRDLDRAPGQSQRRFVHTLGVDEERTRPRVRAASAAAGMHAPSPDVTSPDVTSPDVTSPDVASPHVGSPSSGSFDAADLRAQVATLLGRQAALEARFAQLEADLADLRSTLD